MTDFHHLLSPIRIGDRTVQNRIMLTTHNPKMSEKRYLKYLETRVAAGVGVVGIPVLHEAISTLAFVDGGKLDHVGVNDIDNGPDPETDEGRDYYDALLVPQLKARADVAHQHGALAFGQIANRGAIRLPETMQAMVAPSAIADPQVRVQAHELTVSEIRRVVKLFGRSAARIKKAGLDGVEIHAAHAYLIEQFLSPVYNRRTDQYGGSPENRMRFLLEVVAEVREACGDDYPIGLRISGLEPGQPDYTPDDIAAAVGRIEAELVYVNITAGTIMALQDGVGLPYVASAYFAPAFNAEAAKRIRHDLSVPLGLTGRMNDPRVMEQILEAGVADIIGTARAFLADPDFLTKTAAGQPERIHKCIGINECHYPDRVSACPVNPFAGREDELDLPLPKVAKRVLVIGGGPAGLTAARTAAQRGHAVTLVESSKHLGGKLAILQKDPARQEMANLLADLVREVGEAGVAVRLGETVTPDSLAGYKADAVVVATGSVPDIPDLPGIDDVPTFSGLSLLETDLDAVGENVLVVAGLNNHVAPLAAADYLAGRGKTVTLISENVFVGQDAEPSIAHLLTKRLMENHVRVLNASQIVKAGVNAEVRNTFTGEVTTIPVHAIVFVASSTAVDFPEQAGEFYRIGDALAPRRLVHASLDGARIGSRL